jgi:phosphatidylserine/phosphatidylglycerophosphate/cardiolipin synthase-like enzyme
MRVNAFQDGLTVRIIAGTHSLLLGFDLEESLRTGCLGFAIQRTDLGAAANPLPVKEQNPQWILNRLRFPKDPLQGDYKPDTSDHSPVQKFRWGDWTVHPGERYRYTVTARYGTWDHLTDGPSIQLEVGTEDPHSPQSSVFFNRGAAASEAYNEKFGEADPDSLPADKQQAAYAWLSNGLEEAILAFLEQASDSSYTLHAVIYEFQKPNLLNGLKAALDRGVKVQVVYHSRRANPKDDTWSKNAAAIQAAGLKAVCLPRQASPQSAICHDKFVVLLKNDLPQAVWTGSTNWTDGAIYGQLNVGHAVYDAEIASRYDQYFKLLSSDPQASPLKHELAKLAPPPTNLPDGSGIWPIFSPQPNTNMLDLYASLSKQATHLMVCAPFELAQQIQHAFENPPAEVLHFLLLDKQSSLGSVNEVKLVSGEAQNEVSIATTLSSPLHDFQNHLFESKESFHHAGVHIHAKIIAVNLLSNDPIIVTGSANYSDGSTIRNDENSIILRGNTAAADIYATEFMRMFEHYYFRALRAQNSTQPSPQQPPTSQMGTHLAADGKMGLNETDQWSLKDYVPGSPRAISRQLFAGTIFQNAAFAQAKG